MPSPGTLKTTQADQSTYTKAEVDALIAGVAFGNVPVGGIIFYGGDSSPADNFMVCDGAAVSRVQYATVFSRLGTKHGAGDGFTTFNLPDLRSRAPYGVGTDPSVFGVEFWDVGTKRGAAKHVQTIAEMPTHSHDIQYSVNDNSRVQTSLDGGGSPNSRNTAGNIVKAAGGGQAMSIQSPGLGLLPLIRML